MPLRILALRSDIAKPVLTDGLRAAGHDVESVVAYRTVGVPIAAEIVADAAAGRFDAILVTSGSVANQIALQIGLVPSRDRARLHRPAHRRRRGGRGAARRPRREGALERVPHPHARGAGRPPQERDQDHGQDHAGVDHSHDR